MKCSCKEVEHDLMKQDDACPEHGTVAQWFYAKEDGYIAEAVQHHVQLTALRHRLALSLLFNAILLAVVLFTIGGN
jgi:hypothetical protein